MPAVTRRAGGPAARDHRPLHRADGRRLPGRHLGHLIALALVVAIGVIMIFLATLLFPLALQIVGRRAGAARPHGPARLADRADGPPRRGRPLAVALARRRRRRRSSARMDAAAAAAADARRADRRASELGPPVCVLFEGWDASGKGGAIKRLVAADRPPPRPRRPVRGADPRREAPPLPLALLAELPGLGRDGRLRPLLVRAGAGRAGRGLRDRASSGCAPTTRSTTSSARSPTRA